MRKLRNVAIVCALTLALTGCAAHATTEQPAVPPTHSAVQTPTPTATTNDLAQRTQAALLDALRVKTFPEVLTTTPDSLFGYIASIESPVSGDIVVTVQMDQTETTQAELQLLSRHVLTLVGQQLTDLTRVESVTADSLLRGVENRSSIPTLNQ